MVFDEIKICLHAMVFIFLSWLSEQHKKSVQRQKKKEKQERKTEEGNPDLTDVEVWRRLDALERQESERQELQKYTLSKENHLYNLTIC